MFTSFDVDLGLLVKSNKVTYSPLNEEQLKMYGWTDKSQLPDGIYSSWKRILYSFLFFKGPPSKPFGGVFGRPRGVIGGLENHQ